MGGTIANRTKNRLERTASTSHDSSRPEGRWSSAGDGVRNYRFQLFPGSADKIGESKAPVVDQPGLTEPQLTLTDLPPGAYSWRVTAVRFKNGTITEKVGPLQTLQIGK